MQTEIPSVFMAGNSSSLPLKSAYQTETLRPIVSLVFIVPILLVYELACIGFDQTAIRTGVDQWLHQFLSTMGIGPVIVLPILTAGVLLFLHHRNGDNWQMHPKTFLAMLVESAGLGMILFFAARAYHLFAYDLEVTAVACSIAGESNRHWLGDTFGYFGAGIYEELIFRLLLLPGLIVLFSKFLDRKRTAMLLGLLVTSLLFAISHYNIINPAGTSFELSSFVFRFLASVLFCVIFIYRGFGIAVGTHVAYDVLTQI